MESFILAMVRHPEAYKKAQEEIDRVVGNERLPTLDDREALPYLDCVLKEVLR
jgi:cytochrome P450